ncbi:hypothetical protein MANI_110838 [Metarhizium anisopliae]|nr:hypothetical protein MANI_110838 [Metarhizium anisopliae]
MSGTEPIQTTQVPETNPVNIVDHEGRGADTPREREKEKDDEETEEEAAEEEEAEEDEEEEIEEALPPPAQSYPTGANTKQDPRIIPKHHFYITGKGASQTATKQNSTISTSTTKNPYFTIKKQFRPQPRTDDIEPPSEATAREPPSETTSREIIEESSRPTNLLFLTRHMGDRTKTWIKNDVLWPDELLVPKIPTACILTFGYDAEIVHFWFRPAENRVKLYASATERLPHAYEANHYSLCGRLRKPKSGFEALQRSFSLSVEHLRRAEPSCASANRTSVLMNSIAVSGGTAGGQRTVRVHDKTKRRDGLKPSVEILGGLFFGCSLERLLCFVAVFARDEYGALAIPKQSVPPPQPSWKGLWRELILELHTLDDGPWRCLGGAFGQRVCMVQ